MITIVVMLMIPVYLFGMFVGAVWALAAPKVFCKFGIHAVVEEGGGMMQDARRCLICSTDKYPEHFGIACTVLDIKKVRRLE